MKPEPTDSSDRPLGDILRVVQEQSDRSLGTYRTDPGRILEDANGERRITQGGYGERQLYEVVQNGVDEMRDMPAPGGRIHAVLTRDHLYCANEGHPVTAEGAETILRMGVSKKRGGQIGRFGVGVKSVLSVTDTPQFFSVTGSFGFDREWSARRIREVRPDASETPVLRLAKPLDLTEARRADDVLDGLFADGAVTVVRLPLLPGASARLARDIRDFPDEFSLFSPHVAVVELEDRRDGSKYRRALRSRREGAHHTVVVSVDGRESATHRWRVFSRPYSPSVETRATSGELHDRSVIDMSWAVPHVGRELGSFWAYFPTHYPTTLRGILNAAWKTNEDRQHLLDGSPLNEELLRAAADLIVDSLPNLVDPSDPGSYLVQLPGRYKERRNWADGRITQCVWQAAAMKPSLPDQRGALRKPGRLRFPPENLSMEWLEMWASHPGRPTAWVHRSAEQDRERRGKLGHILEQAKRERAGVVEWLEALVLDESATASACALRILAGLIREGSPFAAEARKARILLTEQHGLVAPRPNTVFRRVLNDALPNEMVYVHADIAADPSLSADLDRIGIHEADAVGRFEAVVDQGFDRYTTSLWEEFWKLSRMAGTGQSARILTSKVESPTETLMVMNAMGRFLPIRQCLLPGEVVPGDGSRDRAVAVDGRFHRDDLTLLRDLGALSGPELERDPRTEDWYEDYLDAVHGAYCATLPANASRPQKSSIVLSGARPAGPLGFLTRLSEEGRAAFIAAIPDRGAVRNWTFKVGRQSRAERQFVSPLCWLISRHGYLATSQGVLPTRSCVGPDLAKHAAILPVTRGLSGNFADTLALPATLEDVSQRVWNRVLGLISESSDEKFVGHAYTLLTRAGAEFPDDAQTRCLVGSAWESRPDDEIAVTADAAEFRALVREAVPVLLVRSAEDAALMREHWGMRAPDDVIEKEIGFAPEGEPELLLDRFPALRMILGSRADDAWFQQCSQLEEVVRADNRARSVPRKSALQRRTALIEHPEGDLEILVESAKAFGWPLSESQCRDVLARQARQQATERFQKVARTEGLIDKLLLLIGATALRSGLPEGLWDDDRVTSGVEPDDRRVAELAYNSHKDEILQRYRKDIAAWDDAPAQFHGGPGARRFVNSLGLPDAFAGVQVESPPAMESVMGPVDFPRLHDYQERLAGNLFYLLTDPDPKRAMLCMPTGSGKTRIAAEAVIRAVKHRRPSGPVLWIAQSEELCEQAVQSWKFVWSKVGPEREPLSISRLWGSNSASDIRSMPHLVVTIDAKLERCLPDDGYAWLREPACIIVDEAHTSLSPRYTSLFEQLGIGPRNKTERPLVGLTATPFRGNSENETKRLVQRYGKTRLDRGVLEENPYPQLQKMGVLAHVEQRVLRGATVSMTEAEKSSLDSFGSLPRSVEQRIADDHERNRMLVDEIASLPSGWPVLLFATSVAHAKLVAAKLSDVGVSAEAIDASTPPGERRRRVDAFRSGEIRVLSNYGVLAQGFDAPATRVVVVSRPTYSPNAYQQMIGRGLRGPKNGGKETCLILNVHDNIENYGADLAFTEFEYLWERR